MQKGWLRMNNYLQPAEKQSLGRPENKQTHRAGAGAEEPSANWWTVKKTFLYVCPRWSLWALQERKTVAKMHDQLHDVPVLMCMWDCYMLLCTVQNKHLKVLKNPDRMFDRHTMDFGKLSSFPGFGHLQCWRSGHGSRSPGPELCWFFWGRDPQLSQKEDIMSLMHYSIQWPSKTT